MGFQTEEKAWGWIPIVNSHPKMLVLLWMARHCHDTGNQRTPERVYRGGHMPLAEVLRFSDVRAGRDATPEQMETVGQYVRQLCKVGALEPVVRARHGATAEYRVNFPPVDYGATPGASHDA